MTETFCSRSAATPAVLVAFADPMVQPVPFVQSVSVSKVPLVTLLEPSVATAPPEISKEEAGTVVPIPSLSLVSSQNSSGLSCVSVPPAPANTTLPWVNPSGVTVPPETSPVRSPVTLPVTSPTTFPVKFPVTLPVRLPVVFPNISPLTIRSCESVKFPVIGPLLPSNLKYVVDDRLVVRYPASL